METRHIRSPRQWDQSGMPMADDAESIVKERFFLDQKSILHDEITTTDNSLTRPWTVMKNYGRRLARHWPENNCIEEADYLGPRSGKERLFTLNADGTIMHRSIKKGGGEAPPDPKYFEKSSQK